MHHDIVFRQPVRARLIRVCRSETSCVTQSRARVLQVCAKALKARWDGCAPSGLGGGPLPYVMLHPSVSASFTAWSNSGLISGAGR